MGRLHSVSATTRILPYESHLDKTQQLNHHLDRIATLDQNFLTLVKTIIKNEGSEGKIVTAIIENAEEQLLENEVAINLAADDITRMVQTFDDQTDDMKTQSMTIYYEVDEEIG